jgi:DNA repair exonuclease SbcCD nuclease subunit
MRSDDFVTTQRKKIEEIIDIFKREKCDAAVCTGDLFDRHDPPLALVNDYLTLFREFDGKFYIEPGNHDLYGASMSTIQRTALETMHRAGVVRLLDAQGWAIQDHNNYLCRLWGTSYFDPSDLYMREHDLCAHDNFHVLVAHNMVIEDKLWAEQDEESFDYPEAFVAKYQGFGLILCGHYHGAIRARVGDVDVINPGAVVRVKASKFDFVLEPSVVIYTLPDRTQKWIKLEAALPVDQVFLKKEEKIDTENPELEAFVANMLNGGAQESSLSSLTEAVISQSKCTDRVASVVREAIDSVRS